MSLVTTDKVKQNCTAIGFDDIILTSSILGYRSFPSVMSNGDTCYYSITNSDTGEWETGIGTLSSSNTLSRTTVNTSSNENVKVFFSAGAKSVGLAFTADQLAQYALTSDLSPYALTSSLSSYALTSSLSSYALTSDLSPYALASSLSSYALTSDLSPYALTSSLSSYALVANTVSAFNNRTGNVTLTANDITTLVNANYIQVWRDTQTTAGILANFPKYSAITSSSGPVLGYSRGLLTSNTSGTITKTIFDGNLYASSVSSILQYKSIGFNANDTGAANTSKSGRLLVGQYGEVFLESSTKVNANTLTTATFDVQATQRPSGTTQTLDPHAINGGIHARYAIGTTGAYSPSSSADRVFGGKVAEIDLYNITRIISFSNGTYIGRPAQVYLTATNDLTAADPDLAFDHAYDYKTTLSIGESAELVFRNANRTLLRTPNMTDYSILTRGYADTRYNLALNNVTHANSTDLTAGGAIRGDTHNFTSGAYTIQQYNGFLSASNTTEPTSVRIGRTCITTSTGLPFLDNYYRAAGAFSGIHSVKPQSNASATFTLYNAGAVSALTEVVAGDSAPGSRSKVLLGYGAVGENYPENVSGAHVSLEATDDNNGTIKSYVIANSTHAQSQLRLFAGVSGNLTMLYNSNSILTQGYADTRYQQTPNTTFTGNFTSQDGKVVSVVNGIIISVV